MDPQLGHFITVDPLVSKTRQPYLYANGNPTTLSDPSGLEPCPKTGCTGDERLDPRQTGPAATTTSSCDDLACSQRLDFDVPIVSGAGQVYVGAYIPAADAGGWFFSSHGDDRGAWEDPGDCSASRACMWLNFDTGEGVLIVNYSCDDDGCYDAWALGTTENSVTIAGDGRNTPFAVDVSATNSARGVFGLVAPLTVDFSVEALSDASGGYVDVGYELFPSYELLVDGNTYHADATPQIWGVPLGLELTTHLIYEWEWASIGTLPPAPTSTQAT